MADKKTFLMYKSWNPMLETLPYEKLGELMYSILLYQDGETDVQPTDPMVAAMFAMIKNTMDQDAEKYAETCAKRAESGRQGGRPKKQDENQTEANGSEDKPKKANGFSEKQSEAKKADTDNENDNDTDNDNVSDTDSLKKRKKEKKKKKKEPPVDYEGMIERSALPTMVAEKVAEWVQYKQERKEQYKEMGFKAFITQTEGYVLDYGSESVIDVINRTMASGYKGVVWDWLKNTKPATTGKLDWERL